MARQRIIGEWLEIPPVASTEEMVDHLNRTIRTLVEAIERVGAFVMYRSTASEKSPTVNPYGIWDLRNNALVPHSATSGNVEPKENEADDLGSSSYKWQKGWFKDVHVDNQLTDETNSTTVQEIRGHIDADVPASSPHGIQPVDTTSTDTTKNKVLSNALAKSWEDHKNTTSGNPHGVDFVELDDAPSDYTGQAGKAVVVKSTEDGLEFSSPSPDVHGNEAHDPDMLPLSTSSAISASMSGNEWLSVATSGIVGLPKQSAVNARLSSAQDIPDQTETVVQLSTKVFDRQNEFDTTNYRFTASEDGIYLVLGRVEWNGSTIVADKKYQVRIKKNGDWVALGDVHSSHAEYLTSVAFAILELDSGDYVELTVWHNTGSTAQLAYAPQDTNLYVAKIA